MIVIVITKEFAESNKGKTNNQVSFDYTMLKSGEYVCALESLKDFQELFDGLDVSLKNITPDDFLEQNIENE